MSKKIQFCILAVITLALTASCSKDFFEQYPSNNVSDGNFYLSEKDFDQAVRGCYARLTAQLAWHITELAYRSDEAKLDDMTTSTQERFSNDHFQELSTAGMFKDVWTAWYSGINRCNDVLDHIAASSLELPSSYEAEARFLRAWFYFNLYRTFGVVPIVKTVVSPKEASLVPRCEASQMLELLESDLSFASENLPSTRPSEVSRATKMAAGALLAKVYLTFSEYSKAETILKPLQSDSFYGLMDSPADVFNYENKLNKEMVFFVYFNNSNGSGHGAWWAVTSLNDIKNPTPEFLSIYDSKDSRLKLLSQYQKISNTNYLMKKWYTPFDSVYTTQVNSDFPHIRYADVVLMMAEALAFQEKYSDALPYLNKTRVRAGLDGLAVSDVSSKDKFISALADERAREFALEGQRWYDLVRLGLAVNFFSSRGYTIDNHNLLFPIPYDEIQIVANDKVLWQNPGF